MKNWEFHVGVLEPEDDGAEIQVQVVMVFDQTVSIGELPEVVHTAAQDLLTSVETGAFIRGVTSKMVETIIALEMPPGEPN